VTPAFTAVPDWEQLPEEMAYADCADVAVDRNDRVYLLTRRPARVLVYNPDGTFVTEWGRGAFSERPHAITVGTDGIVYVVDEDDCTVKRFTSDGEPIDRIGMSGAASDTGANWSIPNFRLRTESVIRSAPPFNHPTKLIESATGDLLVTDGYGNSRVHQFTHDGSLIRSWGSPGSERGEFRIPHSIAESPDGRILVADRENDRIQVFGAGGAFDDEWTDVQRPSSIVVDSAGLVYITEMARSKGHYSFRLGPAIREMTASLSIFDLSGRRLAQLSAELVPGELGAFVGPHGLAIDSHGSVYVAECVGSVFPIRVAAGDRIDPDVTCPTIQKFVRSD
jgi:DNA-binding beta-propeller fold protein YncE